MPSTECAPNEPNHILFVACLQPLCAALLGAVTQLAAEPDSGQLLLNPGPFSSNHTNSCNGSYFSVPSWMFVFSRTSHHCLLCLNDFDFRHRVSRLSSYFYHKGSHLHCGRLNPSGTNLWWVAVQVRDHEGGGKKAGEGGRPREKTRSAKPKERNKPKNGRYIQKKTDLSARETERRKKKKTWKKREREMK